MALTTDEIAKGVELGLARFAKATEWTGRVSEMAEGVTAIRELLTARGGQSPADRSEVARQSQVALAVERPAAKLVRQINNLLTGLNIDTYNLVFPIETGGFRTVTVRNLGELKRDLIQAILGNDTHLLLNKADGTDVTYRIGGLFDEELIGAEFKKIVDEYKASQQGNT